MASPSEIPITELPVQQLQQLAQSLDQEIEFMQNSLQQLKVVQAKFVESQESLTKVDKEKTGKEILVPLTSSMYVPGHLEDTEKVLLDIGTGYYVEKNVKAAEEHFKKKIEFVTKQMEKIQPAMQEKFKMKQAVVEILQLKVQAQMQSQAQEAK